MRVRSVSVAFFLLVTTPLAAGEQILPVFALNIPGPGNSLWSTEVFATNLGDQTVVVHEGSLIRGESDNGVPCLPLVQPFLEIPPHETRRWSPGELALGIGCPAWARGGLSFWSDGEVSITSRMVNTREGVRNDDLLKGFSQEIPVWRLEDLPRSAGPLLLPGVVWHPNSCGPAAFDTNLFITNPGDIPVTVDLRLVPEFPDGLVINGVEVESPYRFVVAERTHLFFRVAGPNSMLTVCMEPVVGTLSISTDGPLAILASVIDRSTQDARTVVPVAPR